MAVDKWQMSTVIRLVCYQNDIVIAFLECASYCTKDCASILVDGYAITFIHPNYLGFQSSKLKNAIQCKYKNEVELLKIIRVFIADCAKSSGLLHFPSTTMTNSDKRIMTIIKNGEFVGVFGCGFGRVTCLCKKSVCYRGLTTSKVLLIPYCSSDQSEPDQQQSNIDNNCHVCVVHMQVSMIMMQVFADNRDRRRWSV